MVCGMGWRFTLAGEIILPAASSDWGYGKRVSFSSMHMHGTIITMLLYMYINIYEVGTRISHEIRENY